MAGHPTAQSIHAIRATPATTNPTFASCLSTCRLCTFRDSLIQWLLLLDPPEPVPFG